MTDPGDNRSRFDPDAGVVLYNEAHADYLLAKDEEAALLFYLITLVAEKYVVYNIPKAAPQDLLEEFDPHARASASPPPQTPLTKKAVSDIPATGLKRLLSTALRGELQHIEQCRARATRLTLPSEQWNGREGKASPPSKQR